jgi:hypothetical protein
MALILMSRKLVYVVYRNLFGGNNGQCQAGQVVPRQGSQLFTWPPLLPRAESARADRRQQAFPHFVRILQVIQRIREAVACAMSGCWA